MNMEVSLIPKSLFQNGVAELTFARGRILEIPIYHICL